MSISRLGIEHREEAVEAFRQERVREDRVRHGGVSELAQHGDLDHGHDLAAFTRENRAAEDLAAVRVDDDLRVPGSDPRPDGSGWRGGSRQAPAQPGQAEASTQGTWCALVGMPEVGVAAAAEAGLVLSRVALVPEPGPDLVAVTSALLDGL